MLVVFPSPVGFQLAVPSSRGYQDPNENKDFIGSRHQKDRAAGVRVQIFGREARAEIQNLIRLLSTGDDAPSTVARAMSKV